MRREATFLLIILGVAIFASPSMGHQPFFEEKDITADAPWQIRDPTISTAIYATLDSPDDVDYYTFNGSSGQSILLSITIPQIAGQENFTPAMALMGPGLPPGELPKNIVKPQQYGVQILPPPENATPFYEPFSRTSYWTRQEQYVNLTANGSYLVAVWDEKGQMGRYVFVIGDKEVLGGDPAFPLKMRNYWTPVNQSATNNLEAKAQANNTSKRQSLRDPMPQPDLGIAVSTMSIAVMAFFMMRR